jgi:hypothetical protein
MLLELVRRAACRDEMNLVEIETAVGGAGHGKMAAVNRIKGPAEERNTARMMLSGGAMRLRCRQCASQGLILSNFLTIP